MEPPGDGLATWMYFLIVGLGWMVPGAIMGCIIYFTTKSSSPPPKLVNLFAVLAFIQSVAVISFSAESIVDLL